MILIQKEKVLGMDGSDSANRLVISCMDRRLSGYLDSKYNDGKTLFLRNAGANVKTLGNSILSILKSNGITKVVIAPHTDCGAMGYVEKVLTGAATPSPQLDEALVSQFKGSQHENRDELERDVNPMTQRVEFDDAAGDSADGIEVSTDLIEISKLEIPAHEGEHILTITRPSAIPYGDLLKRYSGVGMFDSYFVQSGSVSDVSPDIELAITGLHISDVRLVSTGGEDLSKDLEYLKAQPYASSARFSLL